MDGLGLCGEEDEDGIDVATGGLEAEWEGG